MHSTILLYQGRKVITEQERNKGPIDRRLSRHTTAQLPIALAFL